MGQVPLLLTDEPLPPYSYVTGKFPHPIRDPAGHSYGHAPNVVVKCDPIKWQGCREYLRGLDLFNHGYYWESHEAWEAVWHASGREGVTADFLKALIKLAAALVKGREGRRDGVVRHATRATELLESVKARLRPPAPSYMGLQFTDLGALAGRLQSQATAFLNTSNDPVVPFHEVSLVPGSRSQADA